MTGSNGIHPASGAAQAASPAAGARTLDARLQEAQARGLVLVGTLDPTVLATRLLDDALDLCRATAGALWVTEATDHAAGGAATAPLRCRATRGDVARVEAAERTAATEPDVVAAATSDGRPTVIASLADPVHRAADEAPARRIGVLYLHRPADAAPFDDADRRVLDALAGSAGVALANAGRVVALVRAADRSADLALVLEMSREITATLHLDRVARTAVNLAARVLAFDRGALALYERGVCEVRALAGVAEVDPADPALRSLAARATFAAGHGEAFHLTDRHEPESDAERIFVQLFGDDLDADGVAAGLYLPLHDEEGVVGVLLFEAGGPHFADARQRELAAILANLATVALRNARLYGQVPMVDALHALGAGRRAIGDRLRAAPQRARLAAAGAVALAVAALVLVRWPLRVAGHDATLRPLALTEVRALVPGVVERVLVDEGASVVPGAPLVQLRDRERRAERDAAAASVLAAEQAAALAEARGDVAGAVVERRRAGTLREAAALLDEQLSATLLRAPVAGVVLTARPTERVGTHLAAGDAALVVGRTDSLELEFTVDERDVGEVRVGAPVRLRVEALPQRTMPGTVRGVAPHAWDVGPAGAPAGAPAGDLAPRRGAAAPRPGFAVRALVANDDGLLRPGMRAHVRVLARPASLPGRLLREPMRRARLLWWRWQP